MTTGLSITSVKINGQIKHISDLNPLELSNEWRKRQHELNELYKINAEANAGWRGFLLRIIGVNLPDRNVIRLGGVNSKDELIYPEN